MIKGLLFGLTSIAVLWLAIATFRNERGKPLRWSPFDVKGTPGQKKEPPDRTAAQTKASGSNWRARRR